MNLFGKNIHKEILVEKERYKLIMNMNSNVIIEYDIDENIIVFSSNNENLELRGRTISRVEEALKKETRVHTDDKNKIIKFLKDKEDGDVKFRLLNKLGNWEWYLARGFMVYDNNKPKTLVACIINCEKRISEEENYLNQLRLDSLTQLLNKDYSKDLIETFIKNTNIDKNTLEHALMIIDIDNFSEVNKSFGRFFADSVLTNISERLKKVFSQNDIVARIGADVFLVFVKNVQNKDVITNKINEIFKVFHNSYIGEKIQFKLSCSIGVALYPGNGKDYLSLFINADKALYEAKKTDEMCYVFYEGLMDNLIINPDIKEFDNKNNEQYLNKYEIEIESLQKVSDFDRNLMDFAFDIMSKTKDVNSAIYLLLDKVGKHCNASNIWIMDKKVDETSLDITYMWNCEEGIIKNNIKNKYSNILLEEYADYFDENYIFSISNIEEFKLRNIDFNIPINSTTKALLQCGIFEDDIFKGCVCIDDSEKTRNWSKQEVNSLLNITKIISSYLLKIRASERTQKRLDKIKNYDTLTGLSTLHKFKSDAQKILKNSYQNQYAVLYSDISNFKYSNDTLGYEKGDLILCDFARIITEEFKSEIGHGRVSSDKFVMLIEYNDSDELEKKILEVSKKFNLFQKSKNLNINLSIATGISKVEEDSMDITSVIDNANIARKTLKTSIKSVCKFYDSSMLDKITREMEITNDMEDALKNKEFIVYFQPKIGLEDNTIVGAEALVRWLKNKDCLVYPDEFIPLFEKNGFIVNLDFYVYEEVCKFIRGWIDSELNYTVVPISVNVSRVHLNDENFVKNFKKLVKKYEIPHNMLELELTESIFLHDTEKALDIMRELRESGFGVSIDDFGAGYSSLNLLKNMTTDVLKLDKEFFGKGELQKEEEIILSSIINMAKQLNMKVLSEGVETQSQSDFLKGVSCDMAQGYLFAKPMPINEFEQLIKGNS